MTSVQQKETGVQKTKKGPQKEIPAEKTGS